MNKKEKTLNELETILVKLVMSHFKVAGMKITNQKARNFISKIGCRIMFGKTLDDVILPTNRKKEK